MLDFLRQSSTSFWAWLILLALAAAFGLSFGLPSDSLTFGSAPIVEVRGTNIRDEDYRAQLKLIAGVNRIPKDPAMQKQWGVNEEVLESQIERALLASVGEDMGLETTTRDAEELVARNQYIILGFQLPWNPLDQFNYNVFKNLLAQLQVTESQFLETQSREILAQTVRDLVRSSVVLPEPELRRTYNDSANKLSLHYVRYEVAPFADLVDPSEDDVTAWVESHGDDLEKAYESQGARFTKLPEQIRVSLIAIDKPAQEAGDELLAAARSKIEDARGRIAAGATFRAVAREVSNDEATARKGGDFGWTGLKIGTGLDPKLDDALRALDAGALSDVIEGDNDFFIARIEGRREGDVSKDDALRELAVDAIKESKGKELAKVAAEEDRDAVLGGKALDEVFAAPGAGGGIEDAQVDGDVAARESNEKIRPKAELRETGLFSKAGQIPGLGLMPELVDAAWASSPDTALLPTVYDAPGALILAGLEAKETATDEGFEEARNELYARMWGRKANGITAKWSKRLCLEAIGKGDISVSEDKVARLMTYDVEQADTTQQVKPYAVCDRVGQQGGILSAAIRMSMFQR